MAIAVLPITGAWWSNGSSGAWNAAEHIWSGKDVSYFRSKIALSTEGLRIVSSSRLVVEICVSGLSSPFGMECILTQDDTILANDCQNNSLTGASSTLNAAAIDRSFAYADAQCTTLLTRETGLNMAAGGKFWLCFDAASFAQSQTYYLYFVRNLRDGYSGTGWMQADISGIVPTLEYINYTAITAPEQFGVDHPVFEGEVTVQWSDATDGEGNPVTGYQLFYQDSRDAQQWGERQQLALLGKDSRSYVDTPDIERGTYRRYQLRAVGDTGMEEFDSAYVSIDTRRNRLPGVPVGLTVAAMLIASGQEAQISWQAAVDPDGDACGYVVGRTVDGQWIETDVGAELSFREMPEGAHGEVIRYAVCAYDSLQAKGEWAFSNDITFNSPPAAPETAQLDKQEYSPGQKVRVSWSGAEDVDGNLAGFMIRCILQNGEESAMADGQEQKGSGEFTFVPDQLEYGQTMRVEVCVYDAFGERSGWVSAGTIRRNDEPHIHIFENGVPGNYVPVAGQGRYMPYVRVNGQWIRHPGAR